MTQWRSLKANMEPEVLDRQIRMSRNVEEHELENALRSLSQHGSRIDPLDRNSHGN